MLGYKKAILTKAQLKKLRQVCVGSFIFFLLVFTGNISLKCRIRGLIKQMNYIIARRLKLRSNLIQEICYCVINFAL
jgi:hypothetical protein